MKKILPFLSIVLSASLFLSCQKSEIELDDHERVLTLKAIQSDFYDTDTTKKAITRALETSFQNGDMIGVFIHTGLTAQTTGNHSVNMRYATSDKGASWRAGNALGDRFASGVTYYSTAYYPYYGSVTDPENIVHKVEQDQSAIAAEDAGATNLEKSDFMISEVAEVKKTDSSSPEVSLTMNHVMTKLVVSLMVPVMIEKQAVIEVKSVTIGNLKLDAKIDLGRQTVTVGSTSGDIVPRLILGDGKAGKVSNYEAIVVPQVVAGNTKLITIICSTDGGDKELNYTVPPTLPMILSSGKKITLSLSSTADLSFTKELDLIDGLAKSNVEFGVKVASGVNWSLSAPNNGWLKLAKKTTDVPVYTISGVGTGAEEVVYVTVTENSSTTTSSVREAVLVLSTTSGANATYLAIQNYYTFGAPSALLAPTSGQTVMSVSAFAANQVWTARSNVEWLKLASSATYGSGSPTDSYGPVTGSLPEAKMYYQVAANQTDSTRTAIVSYAQANASSDVKPVEQKVTQLAADIKFSTSAVGLTKAAGTNVELFRVVAPLGVKWKVASLTAESGKASMGLTLTSGAVVGTEYTGTGGEVVVRGTYSATALTSTRYTDLAFTFGQHGAKQTKSIRLTQEPSNSTYAPQTPSASDYLVINGIKWAKGNLVAKDINNCKVGAPTDAGLYFKFGSLIGWSGGANGDGTGGFDKPALAIKAKPVTYSQNPLYTETPLFLETGVDYTIRVPYATDNGGSSIGDPCRYYLGGSWRMPTSLEFTTLFGNVLSDNPWSTIATGRWNGTPRGAWLGPDAKSESPTASIFLPAVQCREGQGIVNNDVTNVNGYYLSSTALGTNSLGIDFYPDLIYTSWRRERSWGQSYPIRCVEGLSIYLGLTINWSNSAPGGDWLDVSEFGASREQYVLVGGADEWTATVAGAGLSVTPTSGRSGEKATITWAANLRNATDRSGKVTFTSKPTGASIVVNTNQKGAVIPAYKPNPPTPDKYITVNGIKWTVGNLIKVDRSNCMAGDTMDGGLYFKYGSLVGWAGGENGDGRGFSNEGTQTPNAEIVVTPQPYSAIPDWSSCPYFKGGIDATTIVPFVRDGGTSAIGDPCRYYLGSTWRLPIVAETMTMFSNVPNLSPWANCPTGRYVTTPRNGAWGGPDAKSASPVSSLYIPNTGFRTDGNGSLLYVTSGGYIISSSASLSQYFCGLHFNRDQVHPSLNSLTRAGAYPVRCVQGVSINLDPIVEDWLNVGGYGQSIISAVWVGGSTDNWTASAVGQGLSVTPTSGRSGDKLTITWAPNVGTTAPPTRSGWVTISVGGVSRTINTTQNGKTTPPANTVGVGNVAWAKGNLVGNGANGAKIGASTDCGLFFQFGSLIGWAGGANGDGTGENAEPALSINVKPATYGANPEPGWAACPRYTAGTTIADRVPFATDNGASAIGDPCRYYLGSPWRLPTTEEFVALCNGMDGVEKPWASCNGAWQANPEGGNFNNNATKLFFPASGYRHDSQGSFDYVGLAGYGWSSSVLSAFFGFNLTFGRSIVHPQHSYRRSQGFPVRCVQ